ncbi:MULTISPECIES: hypothetical protein [Thermomonosporaceae]|uniref:hypothetical protein n=1 Tax=Thermomonosporaceae TaxID=2012 RepID=UPI00255AA682|nr:MULTISPECIES: hypothetical protein [Thermomonosporaceae]MDL4772427.1 hypothetical protein [Actinomadura xylanilytica]
MRSRTRGALALLPLVLALTLTGCGSGDEDGGKGAGGVAGGPAAGGPGGDVADKQVKFAECMRKNGVDMDDPEPGKGIMVKSTPGSDKGAMDRAMAACRQFGPEANASPGAHPEQEKRAADFAACMRKNGVDFPDPEPGQVGIKIDKKVGDDPDFPKAQKACQSVFAGGPGGFSAGPGGGAGK